MANWVGHGVRTDLEDVDMSNGLTSVFIRVLSLAMSSLASNDRERRLAVWLASRDQAVHGLGVVGFDLVDMPWSRDTFSQDHSFLLSAVRAARNRHEWSRLDFEPRIDGILESLAEFEVLVQAFLPEHVRPVPGKPQWSGEEITTFERCPIHGVYLHSGGCVHCNDC